MGGELGGEGWVVDADAGFFYDPEGAFEGLGFQGSDEGGQEATDDFFAHATGSRATGTKRSCDMAEPYEMQAWMSCRVICG